MNLPFNLQILNRERTQWRNQIKILNKQRLNLDNRIDDAQREYQKLGLRVEQLELILKENSSRKRPKKTNNRIAEITG
jgi:hypothetical protein